MEEEEIVRSAQALAATARMLLTYLGAALVLLGLCKFGVPGVAVRGVGCWGNAFLLAVPLTLAIALCAALWRRLRRA